MTDSKAKLTSAKSEMPVILMVSGGSDSTALLELAALDTQGEEPRGENGKRLLEMLRSCFPSKRTRRYHCLHINHQLRGEASDGDELFVRSRCKELGIPFHSSRVDVIGSMQSSKQSMEACARDLRYAEAARLLAICQERSKGQEGLILTAHTVDDRVETFLMRALVGTGPGGLASIPRKRGNILRPLLDATREELRAFLREQHPNGSDDLLWRDDATNEDGSNFRSRIRMQLMPVMHNLNPGFEHNLARTMDLIADEDDALQARAEGIVYRNLIWKADGIELPLPALKGISTPTIRRVLRQCLLVLQPDARLEFAHIERLTEAAQQAIAREGKSAQGIVSRETTGKCKFSCDVAGGIRAIITGDKLSMRIVEYPD